MEHSGSPCAIKFAQRKQIAESVSREFRKRTNDAEVPVFEEEDWDGTNNPPSEDV